MGGSGSWSASESSSESQKPSKEATRRSDPTVNQRASLDSPAPGLWDSVDSSAVGELNDDSDKRTRTSAAASSLPRRASAAHAQDADERTGRDRVPRADQPSKDGIAKAFADYAATRAVDKVAPELTVGEQADSFPEMEAAGDIDAVSEWLQRAVTAALEAPAVSIGLTPGEAAISAGIGSNLLLAPITGPLEQASTFLEIAGLVAGLAIGSHSLVLVCVKPLLHTQLEHALSQCIDATVSGLLDAPQVGAHPLPPGAFERLQILTPSAGALPATHATASHEFVSAERSLVSSEAHKTPCEVTRDEPLWFCLAFAPKPIRSTPAIGTATIAQKRAVTRPVVLPMGDDNFLRTLPEALRGGSIAEVDLPTGTTMGDLRAGQHVILRMEGVSIAGLSTEMSSQAAYQHPGCLTGRCGPQGGRPCICPCGVCRAARRA